MMASCPGNRRQRVSTGNATREDSVMFLGNGTNMVFIDYEHDVVAVMRRIDGEKAQFVRLLEEALVR